MANLSTSYLGLQLKHPIVAGASPLSKTIEGVQKLADGGASAIVLYSIFEEQLKAESEQIDQFLLYGDENNPEAGNYFPHYDDYNLGPEEYLNHIKQAKEKTDIPIIASLNGYSSGGWVDYAQQIESAGADALELNIYYLPTNPEQTGEEVENKYVAVTKAVTSSIKIPVAVKLNPFLSAPANVALKLTEAGAKGLVLFNRFYQPEINVDEFNVAPSLELSSSEENKLPMRWIAILHNRIQADFASSTGVHSAGDVLKMLMAGANVTQVASVLLKKGSLWITQTVSELNEWLDKKEYSSVGELIGSLSQSKCSEPAAFERANYMKSLMSYTAS